MTSRAFKWILFIALSVSVPLLFNLLTALGFFSLAGIAAIALTSADFLLAIFALVHIAIYGALFYGMAFGVTKLCSRSSSGTRLCIAMGVVAILVWTTFQPWYGWGGYATSKYVPLHVLLQKALIR